MAETKNFSEKLDECLGQHQQEKQRTQRQVEGTMKQLAEKRDAFNNEAFRILTAVVYPKMQELSRRFDNAKLADLDRQVGLHCRCNFSHAALFPATAQLDISMSPGENYDSYMVHYDLEILPILMAYKPHDEANFPIRKSSEALIDQWAEKKIFEFINTYLKLEVDTHYQSDNMMVDPVCGMSFPIQQAACSVKSGEKTFYFCSTVCREAFLKERS
ncbi:MAG: hypothetical protein COV45_05145 [Deltaproteobacteria bacterium CG11_big_fil_rev_8_21_14_0_20_47_16]|nr:MAG: hypothetical protein COV45_05145 [Deltaproteobacteria bacterium CG11_big_fil_rev_8_21_14_0_20_47_16]